MKPKRNSMTLDELVDHLPLQFDFTLVTLKGHLLVEAMLDDYIHSLLKKPDALLAKTRLQFDLKVKLADALSDPYPGLEVWTAVEVLNKIRNSLAHRLSDENLNKLRVEFVRLVARLDYEREPHEDDDRVYLGSIAYLIGVLRGLVPSQDT
jgi:hypothetical protein